jgi:hypothetical protein
MSIFKTQHQHAIDIVRLRWATESEDRYLVARNKSCSEGPYVVVHDLDARDSKPVFAHFRIFIPQNGTFHSLVLKFYQFG